jgi:hypothetical protein
MKRTTKRKAKLDWSRVDAMTEAQRHAASHPVKMEWVLPE